MSKYWNWKKYTRNCRILYEIDKSEITSNSNFNIKFQHINY